jgi:glycosyltransferase involved in cell wall biosynthesis
MKLNFITNHLAKATMPEKPPQIYLFDVTRFIPNTPIEQRKNTITWVTNSYVHKLLGGSECMAHMINVFLKHKGFEINVIGDWETTVYEGIHLINVRDTERIRQAIGSSSILCSQNFGFPEFVVKIAGALNKHVCVFLHTIMDEWDMNPLKYQHHMDSSKLHIIYNTHWVRDFFSSTLDSIVVHPPIQVDKIAKHTTKQYVTLVSPHIHKGGEQLLEIAKRMPHVSFLAVGGHVAEHAIRTNKNIRFIPRSRRMSEIYEQSSVVLMPSAYESWGMVASEAICGGIPVIASPTTGLKENLDYAGIFVPPHSIQEWVDAIQKLLTDSEYYRTVSQQCRTRGQELLQQNKDEFEEMYSFIQAFDR